MLSAQNQSIKKNTEPPARSEGTVWPIDPAVQYIDAGNTLAALYPQFLNIRNVQDPFLGIHDRSRQVTNLRKTFP